MEGGFFGSNMTPLGDFFERGEDEEENAWGTGKKPGLCPKFVISLQEMKQLRVNQ